ncbi:MAG: hypothetical protein JWM14_2152 [Chitinophagaceae bacterium]|nr:hypothetical protein [Chitinophagaceae bacterium]
MRIGIAIVILVDLLIRASDLEAFYSDTGVLPLELLFRKGWNEYFVSVHTISGLWQVQLILFLFSFFCAVMLLMGYRTQLFTVLSWFMLLSLHNRNGFILQGGDDLLRMILFWGMFIPWGARYSYDNIRSSNKKIGFAIPASIALFAYLLQISYLYTGSALLKGPEWNSEFTALYYTYSLDQIAYSLTKYLYYHPSLLKELTRIAYYFELFVPVLFFLPFAHSFFRFMAVLLIVVFHSLNELTLLIGLFPMIGMVAVIGVLPTAAMDKIEALTVRFRMVLSKTIWATGHYINRLITWKPPVVFPFYLHYVQTAVLVFLTVFVFDWNFSNLSFIHSKLSDHFRFIGYSLRLDQSWGMFAPGVFKDDGWYVLKAMPSSEAEPFDLLHPEDELTLDKPKNVVAVFKNDRWRKYSESYLLSDNEFLRGYFCNYARRVWNEKHEDRLIQSLEVIYVKEFTEPDYKYSIPKEEVLWHCE